MRDFRKLLVWQKAQELSTLLDPHVDRIAARKPALADQIDRAANSISANIAESCGRETRPDRKRFLTMSIASSTEVESHFVRARNAGLLTPAECDGFTERSTTIRKMLHALRNRLDE